MSGIYKSLTPKDVRSTSFRAHKSVVATFDGSEVSTECTVYQAEHSLSSSYQFTRQGITNIDNGNSYYTNQFATTNGYYKTAVHAQLDHLFYKEYLSNNKATFGGGAPITLQYRDLGYKARVISFGTLKVGEGILPESLQITASGYRVQDDHNGNLLFVGAGSNGITAYDAADYDNTMMSLTFGRYYKYVDQGVVQVKESVPYGSYKLHTIYNNNSFQVLDTSGSVGVVFTPANTSSIQLNAPNNEFRTIYNLLNRDYAIAFRVKLANLPTTTAIVLSKQDQVTDFAVNLDGSLFVEKNVPTQHPYKISINNSGYVIFSKSDTVTTLTLTSTIPLATGTLYDIVVQRQGTTLSIYINGAPQGTTTDTFFNNVSGTNAGSKEQDCGNNCNLYVGNNYNNTLPLDGTLTYFHMFDRSLTSNEITNLYENWGWLGNYCGNIYYNLGLIVFTHPKLVNAALTNLKLKGTVSLREVETYCTVGPGDFNVTYNRSVHYWNPVHSQYEVDSKFTGSYFRPYVTTVGLYNDNNELLAVAKLSTPIQTSRKTDTTFVVRFDY